MRKLNALLICIALIFTSIAFSGCAAKDKNLVVLGDSIAAGVGASSKEKNYSNIVSSKYGFVLENHAVSGDTTNDLLNIIKTQKIQEKIKNADFIEISIGGNDFLSQKDKLLKRYKNGDLLTLTNEIKDITESVEKNLNTAIEQIQTLNPDLIIIIQTLYTTNVYGLQSILELFIDDFNKIYYNTCEKYSNIQICDVRSAFKNSEKTPIANDNIHPNDDGHKIIADKLSNIFSELGYEPVS